MTLLGLLTIARPPHASRPLPDPDPLGNDVPPYLSASPVDLRHLLTRDELAAVATRRLPTTFTSYRPGKTPFPDALLAEITSLDPGQRDTVRLALTQSLVISQVRLGLIGGDVVWSAGSALRLGMLSGDGCSYPAGC